MKFLLEHNFNLLKKKSLRKRASIIHKVIYKPYDSTTMIFIYIFYINLDHIFSFAFNVGNGDLQFSFIPYYFGFSVIFYFNSVIIVD